jgi:hypothetical protein
MKLPFWRAFPKGAGATSSHNHLLTELTRDVIRRAAPIVRGPRPASRKKPER